MQIPIPNAFTINRFGSSFFPLSLDVTRREGVTRAFLCPQRVEDLCDLIEVAARENLVVFGVGQVSQFDEQTDSPLSLARLAQSAGVGCAVVDDDTIVLPSGRLGALLSTFSHYELSMLDTGSEWSETEVIRSVLTCREQDWGAGSSLLARLASVGFYLSSHDDCYLNIETTGDSFARRAFARTLQFYAGTVLAEAADVADLSDALLDEFWQERFGLAILRDATEIRGRELRIGVAGRAFDFRDGGETPPELWLQYSLTEQRWRLER